MVAVKLSKPIPNIARLRTAEEIAVVALRTNRAAAESITNPKGLLLINRGSPSADSRSSWRRSDSANLWARAGKDWVKARTGTRNLRAVKVPVIMVQSGG